MKEKIAIILGSKSDLEKLKQGMDILKELDIAHRLEIISAHRNPEKLRKLCQEMEGQGIEVVIGSYRLCWDGCGSSRIYCFLC